MPEEDVFLGTAIKFPIEINQFGRAELAVGKDAVKQSIVAVLSTPINTRFFLPEYGSRLHEALFEPDDDVLVSLLRLFIFEAIRDWEKRVKFINVDFEFVPDEALLNVIPQYKILASNEIDSFVFPFYRKLKF